MIKGSNDLPPCEITIDKEGIWYHKGAQIIRKDIIKFFYEHMELDEQGRYIISWKNERCVVDVMDTAFFVQRVDKIDGDFLLYISDETEERLDPESLYIGKDNVLYCQIKAGRFPARFVRPAYYQIAEYIEEENGRFFLKVNNKRYFLNYAQD
ncbi:MAG: hypothetical protein DRG39_07015 [Deltaproteobacteria bacterium]|nr:MAG: hypothetical protein DRG39_07015 [Deltaproteobacteria bacterium]